MRIKTVPAEVNWW